MVTLGKTTQEIKTVGSSQTFFYKVREASNQLLISGFGTKTTYFYFSALFVLAFSFFLKNKFVTSPFLGSYGKYVAIWE